MDIIECLLCADEWQKFYDYKLEKGHLRDAESKKLLEFIENKGYLATAEKLNNGGFFSVPNLSKVNKSSSDKKRIVYTFPEDENYIQKFIAFKLLDFDGLFTDNLYSFRRDTGVKKAISYLMHNPKIKEMYSFKIDISDYFNSVKPNLILPVLKDVLKDETRLYHLIEDMLLNESAIVDGETVKAKKGILAGSPVSGFLANLFLSDVDRYFESIGVLYARYSDDIIIFADNNSELNEYKNKLLSFLYERELAVNENKVAFSIPHEEWTFLGFCYNDGVIDISDISKKKLKMKMRRKARALVRWKNKKHAAPERAVRAFIKYFNRKLYDNYSNSEITWCRWYFPVITTDDSLKEIDSYMQQCIRFIATGTHHSSQHRFTYEQMKALGYTTLVNRYYKFKKDGMI